MEAKKGIKAKKVLFYLLVIGLCLPLIQFFTPFTKEIELKGAIVEPETPIFSFDSLNTGAFQEKYEVYFNEKFGFRSSFIRLHNQIKYSFFNKAQANGVIIGKEGYLYEYQYVSAYYGYDYIGKDSIQNIVSRIKYVQETLKSMNKTLVIVLAPGKGSYLPEYFPDSCKSIVGKTNYVDYLVELKKQKINTLDLKSLFLSKKKTAKYPLYPKYGIHWSNYGQFIAMDTLINFIENKASIKYPEIEITAIDISTENLMGDYDIGEALNLMFRNEPFPMAYPRYKINYPKRNIHKTTVIADSYFWGPYNCGFSKSIFANGSFWFYNNEVYPDHFKKPTLVPSLNFKKEIAENEVIILLTTDANLNRFPFGFSELFIQHFPPK